jgi:RNA polymerase sigma-70 factor (ECF subfamily)
MVSTMGLSVVVRVVDYPDLPDEQLMARLARRDIKAFEALYDRYGTLVYSTALRVVGDAQLAEDIAQEVFLRIWRRPEHYLPERGRFVTWLLSVARNGAVDQIRTRGRRRRHETASEDSVRELPADEGRDPALLAQLADERQKVRQALSSLPPEQRRVIEMAYYGGYTQQEIAVMLNQPLGTVKTRIRLGMQKLRVALEPEVGSK